MATIVNDRDKILQASSIRLIATTVVINPASLVFTKPKNGAAITPTTILLTAVTTVFTSPTYSWEYALATSPGSWTSMGGGSTQTLTGTTFASLLGGSSGSIIYRVTATQSGFLTAISPTISVTYTKEADDPVMVNITRTNASVPTDSAGTLTTNPSPNSGTVISVTRGGTALNYGASGADTFSVSYSVTSGSVTYGSVTNSGTTSSYGDITAMTTDTATVLFTVTVRDASGSAISPSFTVTESFTKIKAADSGYSHYLTRDSVTLEIDNSGNVLSYADAYTDYKVYKGGTDDTSNWTFTKTDYNLASTLTTNHDQIDSFGASTSPTYGSPVDTGSGSGFTAALQGDAIYLSNGRYVIVPYPDDTTSTITSIYTSDNGGTSWTARTVPAGVYYRYVYKSGIGHFLVGYAGASQYVAKSSDGNTWTDITWGSGHKASNGAIVGTSLYTYNTSGGYIDKYDGSTWTTPSISGYSPNSSAIIMQTIEGNGVTLVREYGSHYRIWRTTNGTAYTSVFDSTTTLQSEIVFVGGRFLFVAGKYIWASADGITWNSIYYDSGAVNTTYWFQCINGVYYQVSAGYSGAANKLRVSTDLLNWINVDTSGAFSSTNIDETQFFRVPGASITGSLLLQKNTGSSHYIRTQTFTYSPPSNTLAYVDITASKSGLSSVTRRFTVIKSTTSKPLVITDIYPSNAIYPATANGVVTSYAQSANIKITIKVNGLDETSQWTEVTPVKSDSGITIGGSFPNYSVTAVADGVDTGSVTFAFYRAGYTSQTVVWQYVKDKNNASGGLTVHSFTPLASYAGYTSLKVTTDGRVLIKLSSGESPRWYADWYTPPSATIGNSYWIKAVLDSGDSITTGTMNSYLALSSDREWILENTSAGTTKKSNLRLFLSDNSSGTGVTGYSTVTLESTKP